MGYRRSRYDNEVGACHRLGDLARDKVRSGKLLFPGLHDLNATPVLNRLERRRRARVEPDLVTPERQVSGSGAAAIARPQYRDIPNSHNSSFEF